VRATGRPADGERGYGYVLCEPTRVIACCPASYSCQGGQLGSDFYLFGFPVNLINTRHVIHI